ncbi:MAG: FAD-binding oxidoreductase [Alphaproteobacteria bacterium]|nr:FAD-binding oxidoreductase [Alphaproteobacteria bacterium]
MHVVICGGGAIGASTAYYLSRRDVAVTVVERTGIACAASGKSGGFLARQWSDGLPGEELARRSFDLHAELAAELGGDAWGYRRLTTYAGHADPWEHSHRKGYDVAWLSDGVTVTQEIGSPGNTAQVHPGLYTRAMMQAAETHGAVLRLARVTGLARDRNRVTGVQIEGGDVIQADAVVIAMGPWSILAAMWLPLPAIFGLKGHSLVFDTGTSVPAEAAFLEYPDSGETLSPELFPRPDGTTYVCGISGEEPLPLDPAAVMPDEKSIARLERLCANVSPVLASAPIVARQACFRPIARDGVPVIGDIPGVENAYVATGHSVWGILNAPATGEAMAELITENRASRIDLEPFRPNRLPPLDPARLRRAVQGA